MTHRQHEQLKRLFERALATPAPERSALLERECAEDAALRRRIEAMVAAAEDEHLPTTPIGHEPAPEAKDLPAESDALREGPGTRIGPYKLLQLIGEGGFGSVFMAEQEKPVQRRVALKIIKLGMDTRQVVARFEQERQALAMMDHPNIARVIDAGATETGRPYFVMDLVKGDPIVEHCDKNNVTIEERLELFAQVCNAVQHAHQKGIIHRDIKPSNVLVGTQDGRPQAKVIDFGIAKATSSKLTDKTLFTEHQQVIGTVQYMSPEQVEGSLDIDTRTDVYSLGVVLYELLTGSTPFDSESLKQAMFGEIQRIIREVEPPKPSTRLSQSADTLGIAARRRTEPRRLGRLVRGELDWIVMKTLEKDRSRRYETANGLAMDIGRYLSGEAVVAAPPSAAYRFKKFVRRNKGRVIAATLVLLASLAGTAVATWQAIRATRAEAIATSQSDLSFDALGDLVLKIQIDLDEAQGGRHVRKEILEDTMQKLHRLVESPATSDRLFRRYAMAHMQLGEILWGLNRRGEAEQEYEKAGEYAGRAFRAFPTSDKAKANMGAHYNRMGDVELNYHKRLERARKLYETALQFWEGLAKKMVASPHGDPALPELERINLNDAEEAVADTYDRIGIVALRWDFDYPNAETWFSKSLAIRKRHVEKDPTHSHRVAIGGSYGYLAELALARGDLPSGISLHQQLLEQRKAIYAERRWSLRARRDVADVHGKLGDDLMAARRNDEGHEMYLASRDLYQQALAAEPDDPLYRGLVAHAHYRCGTSFLRLGDAEAARREFSAGLKLRQAVYAEVTDAEQKLNMQPQLMFAVVRAGNHAEAAGLAASVRKNLGMMPVHLVEAGACYGLCAAAVANGKPTEQLGPEEKRLRDEYLSLTLECFEEARVKKYNDFLFMETDADFDWLHETPEFQKWHADFKRSLQPTK